MIYHSEPYNKFDENEQWIRITDGCPNGCEYCYAPKELMVYPIPEIIRNSVKIMDMNLLVQEGALNIIKDLGSRKVKEKNVYYELVCGIDYRRLTFEIARALKTCHFIKMRFAWDYGFIKQHEIKAAINCLIKAGYRPKDIMVFILYNWKIPFSENIKKLDLLKVWGVMVADCCFDNQLSPNFKPIHWTMPELITFRQICRKHNQLINFGIDPEYY